MNPVQYLAPRDILPMYEGYPGPYMINWSHLSKIFPGLQDPSLTDEIKAFREADTDKKYWGMMDPAESNVMIGIVRAMQPRTVFEIGTGKGKLTWYLARESPDFTKIHTLDILPSQVDNARFPIDQFNRGYIRHGDDSVGMAFKDTPLETKIKQHISDSGRFDFSPFYGQMDIVIVDGNHQYQQSTHDLTEALKMVSPGGIVVMDDYDKMHHLAPVVWAVLSEVVGNGRTFYQAFHHPDGPKTQLVFHPNVPEATTKK